jgi:tellurite resistance protein TerC
LPPDASATVPLGFWIGFAVLVAVLLVLDLRVFHRKSHEPSLRESALWTLVWVSLALCFNGFVWWLYATVLDHPNPTKPAVNFLTGYLVEWSLSMDNVFVFAVIFGFFGVPRKYQYRVLFWGILGAVVMRLMFVLLGVQLIEHFIVIMLLFGGFLVYTGIRLAIHDQADEVDPTKNLFLRFAKRHFPVAHGDHGSRFFVREHGKLAVTPLFLVLLVVESTDVMFAVDSVPAIFGITRDPFIVFTSNIFAILGLRALYFLLAGVMDLFRYLHYGLSAILIFIGVKMTIKTLEELPHESWWPLPAYSWLHWPLPDWGSLVVVLGLLALSIVASLVAKRLENRQAMPARAEHPTPDRQSVG